MKVFKIIKVIKLSNIVFKKNPPWIGRRKTTTTTFGNPSTRSFLAPERTARPGLGAIYIRWWWSRINVPLLCGWWSRRSVGPRFSRGVTIGHWPGKPMNISWYCAKCVLNTHRWRLFSRNFNPFWCSLWRNFSAFQNWFDILCQYACFKSI